MKNQYYKFCPVCGNRLTVKYFDNKKRLVCQNKKCHYIFYQNSKPTATTLITNKSGQILLVKRGIKPKFGYWDLPGGFLEEGEHPEDCLKREMKEELGVNVKIINLLGIYTDKYYLKHFLSTLNFYYLSKIIKGKIKPADDISEARWFARNKLPKNLAFKNNKQALQDWLRLKK